MATRTWLKVIALTAAVMVGSVLQPLNYLPSLAQGGCQTFAETGKTVCGRFLEYWQKNGGLAQQGFPISEEMEEVSEMNGRVYVVQYFERAVFEYHPGNQPPHDVLLSQLGTFQYKRKYGAGQPGAAATGPLPSVTVARYFSAIGLDGGTSILIQQSLLSKRLLAQLGNKDPFWGLLGRNFPRYSSTQDAPRTDYAAPGPAWVLLFDGTGSTVAVFTLVKEDDRWKIDYVEPNVLNR